MEDVRAIFGKNLTRLMKEDGVKAIDLAKDLEIDPSQVSRWMHGENIPVHQYLNEIRRKLGWPFHRLFDEGEQPLNEVDLRRAIQAFAELSGFDKPRLRQRKKA